MACHASPFYALQAGHPSNDLTTISGVACQSGRRPVAIFYLFGHPTSYAYGVYLSVASQSFRLLLEGHLGLKKRERLYSSAEERKMGRQKLAVISLG
jgi:hypothetical protein